jgi:hypothetical protein
MTCVACERAKVNPHCGLYMNGCHGCRVRAVALAPKALRQHAYDHIPASERPAFIAEVAAEHQRWQELRKGVRV